MFFTDPDSRHQAQLVQEVDSLTFEEQKRARDRWEQRTNPDSILFPGGERHD